MFILTFPTSVTLGEQDYGNQLVLPGHSPEVIDGIGHGILGCNLGIWVVVALEE